MMAVRRANTVCRALMHHERGERLGDAPAKCLNRLPKLGRVAGGLDVVCEEGVVVRLAKRIGRLGQAGLDVAGQFLCLGRLFALGHREAKPAKARGIVSAEVHLHRERAGCERLGHLPHGLTGLALASAGGPAGLQVAVQRSHRAGFAAANPLLGVVFRAGFQFHHLAVCDEPEFAQEKIALRPLVICAAGTALG